jgi:hypothetical protein
MKPFKEEVLLITLVIAVTACSGSPAGDPLATEMEPVIKELGHDEFCTELPNNQMRKTLVIKTPQAVTLTGPACTGRTVFENTTLKFVDEGALVFTALPPHPETEAVPDQQPDFTILGSIDAEPSRPIFIVDDGAVADPASPASVLNEIGIAPPTHQVIYANWWSGADDAAPGLREIGSPWNRMARGLPSGNLHVAIAPGEYKLTATMNLTRSANTVVDLEGVRLNAQIPDGTALDSTGATSISLKSPTIVGEAPLELYRIPENSGTAVILTPLPNLIREYRLGTRLWVNFPPNWGAATGPAGRVRVQGDGVSETFFRIPGGGIVKGTKRFRRIDGISIDNGDPSGSDAAVLMAAPTLVGLLDARPDWPTSPCPFTQFPQNPEHRESSGKKLITDPVIGGTFGLAGYYNIAAEETKIIGGLIEANDLKPDFDAKYGTMLTAAAPHAGIEDATDEYWAIKHSTPHWIRCTSCPTPTPSYGKPGNGRLNFAFDEMNPSVPAPGFTYCDKPDSASGLEIFGTQLRGIAEEGAIYINGFDHVVLDNTYLAAAGNSLLVVDATQKNVSGPTIENAFTHGVGGDGDGTHDNDKHENMLEIKGAGTVQNLTFTARQASALSNALLTENANIKDATIEYLSLEPIACGPGTEWFSSTLKTRRDVTDASLAVEVSLGEAFRDSYLEMGDLQKLTLATTSMSNSIVDALIIPTGPFTGDKLAPIPITLHWGTSARINSNGQELQGTVLRSVTLDGSPLSHQASTALNVLFKPRGEDIGNTDVTLSMGGQTERWFLARDLSFPPLPPETPPEPQPIVRDVTLPAAVGSNTLTILRLDLDCTKRLRVLSPTGTVLNPDPADQLRPVILEFAVEEGSWVAKSLALPELACTASL